MKYLVLARRFRPQFFRDVIGQEAVLKTLKNALAYKRAAHAYLFCGSRGIGKTTLARLFAKALNCQALSPDFEPCNLCPSCVEILSGQSFDVIEIDGASNRGIDDIRTINETVGYAPSHGKYKIYIIDEVHMLTKEAFNALLKTLEEPPERAKFFFATTEPHKVLSTILSRCQRFDLQRLSEEQITGKLQTIAADIERVAAPEALHRIAQFAEGSLRDAESLFDQILCFADGAITLEHVQSVLGLVPDEYFSSLDIAFAEGRVGFAFELVEKLFQMGKDLTHFLEQLIGYYRRLALLRLSPQVHNAPERLLEAAKLYTQGQLCFILDTLLTSYTEMGKSPMQRVSLEALLLKILRSKQRIPIEVLARRMSELEEKLLESCKNQEAAPPAPSDQESVLEPVPFNPYAPPQVKDKTTVAEAPQPSREIAEAADFVNLDSAGPCQIEPNGRDDCTPCKVEEIQETQSQSCKPGREEDQIREVAVSQNSQNLTECGMTGNDHSQTPPGEAPMHLETLLRFAAVELEGTIQMEK